MSAPPLRLGPFDILRAVGRGAMGEVSLAVHRAQGVEVAIKMLHGTTAADPWAVEAFRNEVRAVAALDHPGIVSVVDHGVLDHDSPLATLGHFDAGTPYLVMEYVKGRPMNRFVGRLSWNQIRAVLLQLLDALAHSHARGVVHRDLKPGNVLLALPSGRLPSLKRLQPNHPLEVKLTDFGLAQALDRHSAADAVVAGTPAYMAPEQLQGRWRDQGPWTDLYSVGCLAWAMATGAPPFGKDQPFEDALHHHLHEPPPLFVPVVPVPPGFEGWLRRLLAKPIAERFPRAADAAWGLARVSATRERVGAGIAPSPLPLPVLEDEELDDDDLLEEDEPTEITESNTTRPVVVVRPTDHDPPERAGTPIPATWRAPGPSSPPKHLFGVGLNLFGIRPPPFVGRIAERDFLWQALREVYATGIGQAVVLRGPNGMGRTRLGSWLCQRADEVGAARVFTARHDNTEEGVNGVVPMVARYLRCAGLPRTVVRDRLARAFPPGDLVEGDVEALTEFLCPDEGDPDSLLARRLRYARERYSLVRRLIERESTGHSTDDWEAVAVVWLDDAHLGSDTLDFCRYLLETQSADPVPVLLLISVQDEGLAAADEPDVARVLEAIAAHPRCHTLPVPPLPEHEHAVLVRTLLGMDSELVERVAARTAGSPEFAVQLVGDWIARGLLHPGPEGFTLAEGAAVELPSGADREWDDRVERCLVGFLPDEGGALELAAVLGNPVDGTEWRTACAIADLRPSDRVVDRLQAQRLIQRDTTDGFHFPRTMLREALIRRARAGGRLHAHHRACATMLERQPVRAPGSSERLGRHLLMSGHVVPALGKLLEGARDRHHRGESDAARRLLEHRARALKRLELPEDDELWGLGWVERAALDLDDGLPSDGEPLLLRAERSAEAHDWPRVAARARLVRGRQHLVAGHLQRALVALDEARTRAIRLQDYPLAAQAWVHLGTVHLRLAQPDRAMGAFGQARDIFARLGDDRGLADCSWHTGRVALSRGEFDRAELDIHDAWERFQKLGYRAGAAEAVNGLGELERLRGDRRAARAHYRRAMEELDAIGHAAATMPRLNLGVVLVEGGQYVQARRLIEPLLRSAGIRARPTFAAAAHLILLVTVADAGDWSAWDHHVGRAGALLASTGLVDRDNAHLAILAAKQAVRGGEVDRARSAYGLAWQQLDAMGDPAARDAVEAEVRALA